MFQEESSRENIKTNHEIDDTIKAEKLQYDINKKQHKCHPCRQVKLINMNLVEVKKDCLLIKVK